MKSYWACLRNANVKTFSTLCIFLSYFLLVSAVTNHREKRGASVYPVYGGNNYGAHGSEQNNFLYLNDPSPFIQYVGGSPSSFSGAHQPAASMYSFSYQPAPSSSSSSSGTPLDFNLLNSYAMSTNHLTPSSGSGSGSGSSGWSPNLGYTGSFYTTDYGLLTPNFASMPMSSSSSGSGRNTHSPTLPTLSASSLAHSASMSFSAQNRLYDVLLSGSSPRSYKGSIE